MDRYEMFKLAAGASDMINMAGRAVKESLVGSEGIKGWSSALRTPIKSTWEGIKNQGPIGWGAMGVFSAPAIYHGLQDESMGYGQRLGRIAGHVVPMTLLGHGALKSRAPGFLGGEVLGGGILMPKGILEAAGEQVDKVLGTKPKMSTTQMPMRTAGEVGLGGDGHTGGTVWSAFDKKPKTSGESGLGGSSAALRRPSF